MTTPHRTRSFMKIHGNGNDFILLDNRSGILSAEQYGPLAQLLCPRRTALGADGILVLEEDKAKEIPLGMRIINADGLEGEMCGNGARCFARYLMEKRLCPPEDIRFRTLAGAMHASASGSSIRLNLGIMDLSPLEQEHILNLEGQEIIYRFVRVGEAGGAGVPHAVVPAQENHLENLGEKKLHQLGRAMRYSAEAFPEGTNVNFLFLEGSECFVRTYERGVEDFTLSCGTGSIASAAALACIQNKSLDTPLQRDVENPGGRNTVHLDPLEKEHGFCRVFLEGATALVCTGEIAGELQRAVERELL